MSEEENVRIIQQFYEDFASGNLDSLLAAMTEDVEFMIPGPTERLPFRKSYRGREEAAVLLRTLMEASEAELLELRDIIAQRDKVVVLLYERTRIKSTGKMLEQHSAYVWTLRAGKIGSCQVFEDTYAEVEAYSAR